MPRTSIDSTAASRSGFGKGRGRRTTALTTLKTAVFADTEGQSKGDRESTVVHILIQVNLLDSLWTLSA